jgi:hypothetical protein
VPDVDVCSSRERSSLSSGVSAQWYWDFIIQLWVQLDEALTQPCLCLWRGSEQITMTRPCRRITLHLSQMGLTLGFTFTASSILFS